jgi:succinyl-CoA synthetase beta subunit
LEIDREFFMAITYDTVAKAPIAIFSIEGGVDIEAVSFQKPAISRKERFSIRSRLQRWLTAVITSAGLIGNNLKT